MLDLEQSMRERKAGSRRVLVDCLAACRQTTRRTRSTTPLARGARGEPSKGACLAQGVIRGAALAQPGKRELRVGCSACPSTHRTRPATSMYVVCH